MFNQKRHLVEITLQQARDIASVTQSCVSLEKRIDENLQKIIDIHRFIANVESLKVIVQRLSDKLDNSVANLGKRLSEAESAIIHLSNMESQIAHLESQAKKTLSQIENIEKEPAQKWKDLVKQVTGLVAAAIVGAALSKLKF